MNAEQKNTRQTMEFDKEIYKKELIDESIIDFAQIASINVDDNGKNWLVTLSAIDENESSFKIINEFGNYVLAKEINS